ncbi:retrovirus-related pol polyprotein from transposon TNT 1-94 [Tanacetum coccineum]
MDEIETINIELEHSVAKLLSENERLHKEIGHLKQIYKDQFDSIKRTRVRNKEHSESLILQLNSKYVENADLTARIQDKVFVITSLKNDLRKLKGKEIVENVAQIPIATTIALGMFKLDLEPISHRLKNNRDAYKDYLKKTIEHTNIIRRTTPRLCLQVYKTRSGTKPTGRLFTLVGNSCPLTRITPTKVVHLKETTSHSVETQKLEIKVYSRRPKQVKNVGSSNKATIVESKIANNSEPNHSWGSNATDVPSSSSFVNDSCQNPDIYYQQSPAKGLRQTLVKQATIYDGKVNVQTMFWGDNLRSLLQAVFLSPTEEKDEHGSTSKVVVVQAQASGQALTEEEIAFLAEPGLPDIQSLRSLGMAQTAITEVTQSSIYNLNYDLFNQSEQIMTSSEQSNDVSQTETDITSDSNIIPYSQYLMTRKRMFNENSSDSKNDLKMEENRNIDREIALEKKIKQLDNIIFKRVPALDPPHSSTTVIVEVPKELPTVSMVNTSLKVLKLYLAGFDQAVEQHRLESRTFEVKMNQVLSENERLLAQAIDKDIVKTVVNLSVNASGETVNECQNRSQTQDELLNKKDFVDNRDLTVLNQNAPSFTQLFELSELRAQSQAKDTVIVKLKEKIKSLNGNVDESTVKMDMDENETLTSELEHRVTNNMNKVWSFAALKMCYGTLKGIGVRLSTSASGSQPSGNTWNDKILQTPSINGSAVVQNLKKQDNSDSVVNVCWLFGLRLLEAHDGDRSQLTNFISKFLGTVKFGNDQVAKIMVAFRQQHASSVSSGVDLLSGSRGDNLYTLSLGNMMASSPICLLSKASKTKSWLWHRRLSHLNFGAINHLARHGLVRDLCGSMRVHVYASVNGKKYILVIVDDYSRFTWVKCLRSKDEAPAFIINFLKMIQVRLKETVRRIRTDNGTEFVNQTLREYYEKVGISHETSVARSPQQNGVVERRNRTLIEAARTMLIYAKAPLFLWAEAVATACYTQNRSMIRRRHGKTPYELLHDKPPDLSYLHVFGALCYPTNDSENLGKLQPKADIGIFIGYAPTKKAFRIYNRRTRRIIETIHVDFDELTAMASEHSSSGPVLHEMTPVSISSGLVPNPPSSTPFVPPSRSDWDLLFQPMFDESLNPPPYVDLQAPEGIAPIPVAVAPEHEHAVSTEFINDIEVAHMGNDPYFGIPIPEVTSDQSSSSDVIHTIVPPDHQVSEHNSKWTKDHPLENIIGALDRPVSTRLQLHEQALFCYYDAFLTSVKPKNYKDALTQACWIEAMQEELHEFERWEPADGFVDQTNLNYVYKLKKLFYGLKQAPRAWYDMLSSFLISNDFSKGSVDPTLFIRREGNELLLVQIYVDDIIFAASTPELCDLFAKIMCSKFKMSMMGKISFFLGLQISQSPRGIFINQSKYALESLKKYGYESCDPVDTPMVEKSKLDEDKEGKAIDPSHYRGMIGTLLYLIASRPDLQFAICMCARYQARPTKKHLNAVKRIFRYLKGTVHRGLWYRRFHSFALTAFADADHAGCQDTRRSTSGSIHFWVLDLLSWSSKRQKALRYPVRRLKYIALSGCCAQVFGAIHNLPTMALDSIKFQFTVITKALLPLCCNNVKHSRSKHIDIQVAEISLHLGAYEVDESVGRFKEDPLDVNVNKLLNPGDLLLTVINNVSSGKTSYDSLHSLSQVKSCGVCTIRRMVDYAYLLWDGLHFPMRNKCTKKGNAMYYTVSPCSRQLCMDKDPSILDETGQLATLYRDDPMFTTINVISRNEYTQLYGTILPVALTNKDIRNSESYKEYYAIASGMIPPKTKKSKKKADTDTITKQKPPTVPKEVKEKKSGKGKQKTTELVTISEADLTEAEQLKNNT